MRKLLAISPALLALAFFAAGCNKPEGTSNTPAEPGSATDGDHEGHDHDAEPHADGDEDPMAALSAEDRVAALAQKVCPVGGDVLGGSMGTPVKVTVEGREVFLCCKGCEETLREDPAKYFAKLDKPAQ